MTKLFILAEIILIGLIGSAAAATPVPDPQPSQKVIRLDGESVTWLLVHGPFQVKVVPGNKAGLHLTIPQDMESKVKATLEGGILSLDFEGFKENEKVDANWKPEFIATVWVDDLRKIEGSVAARITFDGKLRGENLELELGTAAALTGLDWEGNGKGNVTLDINTASHVKDVRFSNARSMKLEVSTAAHLSGKFLKTEQVEVECSTAANAEIEVDTDKVSVEAESAGNVKLAGKAKRFSVETGSGGNVTSHKLKVTK